MSCFYTSLIMKSDASSAAMQVMCQRHAENPAQYLAFDDAVTRAMMGKFACPADSLPRGMNYPDGELYQVNHNCGPMNIQQSKCARIAASACHVTCATDA